MVEQTEDLLADGQPSRLKPRERLVRCSMRLRSFVERAASLEGDLVHDPQLIQGATPLVVKARRE